MICPAELANDLSAWRAAVVGDDAKHGCLHKAAVERAMQVQEVILRAMAKRITVRGEKAGEAVGEERGYTRGLRDAQPLRAGNGCFMARPK
jgi:hypothetical protein